ncbi:MAG: LuxR C-terminal-related transcriptional regulator [Rhodospirillaceae bacterium]|nr:LuxR C-terminal-related transcriptional regulator [Rhodospirillaceae bacterium]
MSVTDTQPQNDGETEATGPADNAPGASRMAPWLLRQKVTIPDRVAGCLERTGLIERALPTRSRITVLQASGGFGKTTLLAECCRRLIQEGVPTAWVSLDERDEAAVLDAYLAFACQCAGLDVMEVAVEGEASEPGSRVGFVARAIESLKGPFVLAIDELERLTDPGAVALLEFLLERGPANLYLALSGRTVPAGLNVARAVLEGHATVLTAEELRFSRAEISRFFGIGLCNPKLGSVVEETAGWPFAVRITRNRRETAVPGSGQALRNVVENWVESRLFGGLDEHERAFLLDMGLFEWIDAGLLDEVLERNDSMRRIDSMPVLVGLIEPVREAGHWRLHPLIRAYCERRRFRESPQRYRRIHRRIAKALARRGETVTAMRHAVEAGEPAWAADILERAGGIRLWIRQGAVQFQAAVRCLPEAVVASRPRLALVGCLGLAISGRLAEARERYEAVTAAGRGEDPPGEGDIELAVDLCIVGGLMSLFGAAPLGSEYLKANLAEYGRLAASGRVDPLSRGHLELGLCVGHELTGRFDEALGHAARARQHFAGNRFHTMFVDLEVGQIAMAQGRAADAARLYRDARAVARAGYALDPVPATSARVLELELSLECGRPVALSDLPRVPRALMARGTLLSNYAAASATVLELTLRDKGVEQALGAAEEMLRYLRGAGLTALCRYVSAMDAALLAMAGRTKAAQRAWQLEGLPVEVGDCANLAGQSWREMEAVCCSRLRLLIAAEQYGEGRALAGALCALAHERSLNRTLMRALALSMALEHRAGDGDAATAHLNHFLGLLAESPYAWPLIRERHDCEERLAGFVESNAKVSSRNLARQLLEAMRGSGEATQPVLSEREQDILARLEEGMRDREIADALGLTVHGVRYHMRKLFAKLGVHTRADAVRRAAQPGLAPDNV